MIRCRFPRIAVAVLGTSFLVVAPSVGHAQAQDQAAARVLFDEGRALMKSGDFTQACPKFDGAAKLFPSAGILLNLADCYEKTGRTASAWTEFGEAAAVASRTNRAGDADEGHNRQQALVPKLSRIAVRVDESVPDLALSLDGAALPQPAWGTAMPVDPGKHEVRAEAKGFAPWSAPVDTPMPGQTTTVTIPKLMALPQPSAETEEPAEDTPAPSAPPRPAPPVVGTITTTNQPPDEAATVTDPDLTPTTHSHAAAWTLFGVGTAVGLGGGALMVVESLSAKNARNYSGGEAGYGSAQESYDNAKTPWTIGLVGAIAGGACAAMGLILVLAAGHEDAPMSVMQLSPWTTDRGGGVRWEGTW
jgi:hypothetical protein